MLYREISHILGKYILYFSFLLILPLFVCIYYEWILDPSVSLHPHSFFFFVLTMVISFLIAFLFMILGRKAKGILHRRESMLLVTLIWLVTAFISALPFYLSSTLENPIDAYFESMSGLTTTGATTFIAKKYEGTKEVLRKDVNTHVPTKTYTYFGTIKPVKDETGQVVLTGVEAVSKGILFWRSFIQWIGGMGIVVLFIAILPALNVGGKFLYQLEVPGPTKDTLAPRIRETSSILWKLYLGLTVAQIYLLILTNPSIPIFDAFCITFSCLSTGGFTVKNQSIGSYHNVFTDWIVILFMILGGINFSLYFHIIRKKIRRIFDPDVLFYFGVILVGALLVSLPLIGKNISYLSGLPGPKMDVFEAIRYGFFQAISSQTSTGFVTANYDLWPFPSQLFMLILMLFGGMSGSTAGGIKTSRFYILIKVIINKIESIFRPEVVQKLKIGDREIALSTATTVLAFVCIAFLVIVLGVILLTLNDIDPETAISSVVCMLHNIGISFRAAGPTQSFAFFPNFSKIVSIIWMLLGRLEYFAILLLLIPGFWRKQT